MNDKENTVRGETVEAAVLRRRNLLKKSVVLGAPLLLLTLPGKAFAQGGGSGGTSGNMSGGTPTNGN